MTKIKITDISLRESELDNATKLSFKEKLETAKLLKKLQVDIIETAPVGQSQTDAIFVRTLATTIETSIISVPVDLDKENVDRTWDALSKAKKPRLNVIAPTSTVQMEYGKQLKADTLLPLLEEIITYATGKCPDVEFTAVDSVRSEPEFLSSVIRTAIKAGVKTITLCDSVGELLPDEFSSFISSVYESVPELTNIVLAIHCRDNLGLASSVALDGIKAGARQIKVTSGADFGTLSLEQFLNIIKIRGDSIGIKTNVNTTALQHTSAQLAALAGTGAVNTTIENTENKPEDTNLTENTDIDTLRSHITALGYDVTEDDLDRIFAQFKEIAGSKKVVNRDIEALIAETAGQSPPTYILKNYVINSGSLITATAFIEIEKDGVVTKSLAGGDGPIDAAINAIEQMLGVHYELEEFVLRAVTGGREATGDALIKLRYGGKLYSGRGVSTDTIRASIRAFISAVNKIVYEDKSLNAKNIKWL